jgi:sulfite reductase (NADPH) flavoprotein alpha-component
MNDMTLPSSAPVIPESAPFSVEQRAWLNGFFAALFSTEQPPVTALSAAAGAAIAGASADEDDAPWHDQTLPMDERMKLAEGRPLPQKLMAAMAQQDCGQCGSSCKEYSGMIAAQAESRLNLCAPGGKETARMLKRLLEETGGGAVAKTEAPAAHIAPKPLSPPGRTRENPSHAHFRSRARLNRDGSEKATYHIEFDLAEGLDYEVGDSFGVFPRNHPQLVEHIIAAIDAPPNFPIGATTLRDTLTHYVALAPAPDMLFELIAVMVGGARRAKAKALARGEDPDGDAATLDVLAALHKFPGIRPDPEAFIEALEPLQPRLYSISSSHKANPGVVSLTVDHVRYTIAERDRFGVASTFVGEALQPGEKIRAYVQPAHEFSLPKDGATPIIMVGPGTGVAPFRAFLHQRMATNASGPAWLFFGHQRSATDFFYEDELAAFQGRGTLTKLSLAWSRDGGKKVYVQDKMREDSAELWAWLEKGAHFYVCGDAKRMAADVEKALIAICIERGAMDETRAKAFLKDLRAKGRYQTDVY